MEESKRISIERKLTESGAFSDLNKEEVYVMDGDGSDCFQICLEKGYLKTKQFKKHLSSRVYMLQKEGD